MIAFAFLPRPFRFEGLRGVDEACLVMNQIRILRGFSDQTSF
jgi:hypothetical protein